MNRTQLERAEERVEQKWYDFVMAEQRGSPEQALERLYTSYMLAVEEYNHCREVAEQQQQQQDAA
jgi:hypothetical protein